LSRLTDRVQLIRNALDTSTYAPSVPASTSSDVRILYYGVLGNLKDYATAQEAIDDVAASHPEVQRVWLGTDDGYLGSLVDEEIPYVVDHRAFPAALVAARPDIGVAPIDDEPYSCARSELHWLEYSMAGAAVVASSVRGPGPYDVIRPGVDGLLARDRADGAGVLDRRPGGTMGRCIQASGVRSRCCAVRPLRRLVVVTTNATAGRRGGRSTSMSRECRHAEGGDVSLGELSAQFGWRMGAASYCRPDGSHAHAAQR
jgi:hypothetical protein